MLFQGKKESETIGERPTKADKGQKDNKCRIIKLIFPNFKGTKDDRDEDEINFQAARKKELKAV